MFVKKHIQKKCNKRYNYIQFWFLWDFSGDQSTDICTPHQSNLQ